MGRHSGFAVQFMDYTNAQLEGRMHPTFLGADLYLLNL